MKKIMIACAAVAIAAVAQAASIDWSVGMNWTMQSGAKAAEGTTVYLIDSAYMSSIVAAISADGSLDASTKGILGSSVTSGTRGKVSELTTTHADLTSGKAYDFAVLIIDTASVKDKTFYAVSAANNQSAYTVGTDEAMSISFNATAINGENALSYANGTAWQAVPEPTSGLLMLVGLAGLALRRRRA